MDNICKESQKKTRVPKDRKGRRDNRNTHKARMFRFT